MSIFDDAFNCYGTVRELTGVFDPHMDALYRALDIPFFDGFSLAGVDAILRAILKEKCGVSV